MKSINEITRRRLLQASSLTLGAFAFSGAKVFAGCPALSPREFQETLLKTPAQTPGPFYPDKLPLDTDNDLIIINENLTAAVGEVTHLTGKIVDINGKPVRNATVEIWQVDSQGVYLHPGSNNHANRDKNFQGFGRFTTTPNGEYYFRTVKPVPYPGRTPHIHFTIKKDRKELLTTQCFIKGHPQNENDGVLRSIEDVKARESVIIDFAAIPDSKIGELAATFNIVVGLTPKG
jgi:protocatechuate 3,4-dioxygenase, beta subunit